MAVDIITLARRRRVELLAELARVDAFLEMAAELAQAGGDSVPSRNVSRSRSAATSRGVGADTVAAGLEIVRTQGPQQTRDLLPLIKDRGIPVGGKSEIATLSARLSTTGKGALQMIQGKWHEAKQDAAPGPETAPEREESADQSVEGRSADSLFNQAKGGTYAAALGSGLN